MASEHVILGAHFRALKTDPFQVLGETGYGQLLNARANQIQVKPHRWAYRSRADKQTP